MYPNVSNTNQQILPAKPSGPVAERMAAQAHSLLPSPTKVLPTAEIHLRCQPRRPAPPPPAFGLSPSKRADLCCSLEAAMYLAVCSLLFEKRFDNWACIAQNSKLDPEPCMNTPYISYIISVNHSISYICAVCISTATLLTYQTRAILIWRRV